MVEQVRVWYDKEADCLEVLFECKAGFFRETDHDAVMEKVDADGDVIGFSILKVSSLNQPLPLSISLSKKAG